MNVRKTLRKWNLRPDKALGQNFLVDQTILERIAEAAHLTSEDIVLEVGAGTGALTKRLARDAGHVVALELDQRLIPILEGELSELQNVSVVQGDVLGLDPPALLQEASAEWRAPLVHYKVVANLPYYITSAILRHVLEADRRPELMVLTVQREVAERIAAGPGDMSILAVSVQFYGDPEILFRIKPGSFYPSPGVESAVLRVDVHPEPPLPREEIDAFFTVVRAGFSQRRKQLHNSLSTGLGERISKHEVAARLEEVGVDPRRRAQSLSVEEWIEVTRELTEAI
ncbi:MAG: 16S rRNA (adenine(1518)-N(6)/adenine(1519)-N(6))-dimethyltransferase RsmA [Chloroflexota bacterium]|nr:16S rRNA (adenine(1518)-N(6)/adenine(1519)-N(6))-dimethyltransferase RsmA [Chloroflexota bacterium]